MLIFLAVSCETVLGMMRYEWYEHEGLAVGRKNARTACVSMPALWYALDHCIFAANNIWMHVYA